MNHPTFRAEIDKLRILSAVAFLLALGIACAYLLLRGPDPDSARAMLRDPRIFYPAVGLGGALFLGLAAFGAAKLRGGSPLRAGPDGLDLNGAIRIAWRDIDRVEPYYDFTDPALHGYKVVLKDPDRFLAAHRDHRLYRRMLSAHQTAGSPVIVYTNSLRYDPQRFDEVVEHYLRESAARLA